MLWVPIVFFIYPETAGRSLESIEAMFSSNSPFYSKMEEVYKAEGNVLAMRGPMAEDGKRDQMQEQDSFEHAEKASDNV